MGQRLQQLSWPALAASINVQSCPLIDSSRRFGASQLPEKESLIVPFCGFGVRSGSKDVSPVTGGRASLLKRWPYLRARGAFFASFHRLGTFYRGPTNARLLADESSERAGYYSRPEECGIFEIKRLAKRGTKLAYDRLASTCTE